jgi:uncharacterized membrane protein YhaH (DUF805 family)
LAATETINIIIGAVGLILWGEYMNFPTAVSTCLSKYATFEGRASRSEFWWFYLFTVLISWGVTIVGNSGSNKIGTALSLLVQLVFLIPSFAVGSRRLHDIGRSGWWQLLILTGIGVILLVVWWATPTQIESYAYGADFEIDGQPTDSGAPVQDAWYYADKGGHVGPLTLNEMRQTLSSFSNAGNVLVWHQGFPDWKSAQHVSELNLPPPPPPLPRD